MSRSARREAFVQGVLCSIAAVLCVLLTGPPASAYPPLDALSASPDVTTSLAATTFDDEDIAADKAAQPR